jgi:uncharacterized protein YggU (UPF0235/DUF167 family)
MKEVAKSVEVKVHTGSANPRIEMRNSELHVYTSKKPVHGEANSDVVRMISEYFKVPKKQIELVKGAKSRNKLFVIRRGIITKGMKSKERGL